MLCELAYIEGEGRRLGDGIRAHVSCSRIRQDLGSVEYGQAIW